MCGSRCMQGWIKMGTGSQQTRKSAAKTTIAAVASVCLYIVFSGFVLSNTSYAWINKAPPPRIAHSSLWRRSLVAHVGGNAEAIAGNSVVSQGQVSLDMIRRTDDLVTTLLACIDGTDSGISASNATKLEIMDIITELERIGAGNDFLADGRAYGKYEVAYVGAPSSRIANPAGGRWRGRVGRLICPTRGLYQHLLRFGAQSSDAVAVNVVEVALLGIIPIVVVLRGSFSRLEKAEREQIGSERSTPGGLSVNSVRANFDAPRICIGSWGKEVLGLGRFAQPLRFCVGPKSSVVLDAPYVDGRIRIAKGASGIRFVLKRVDSTQGNSWQYATAAPPVELKSFGSVCAAIGVLGLSFAFNARTGIPWRGMAPWAILLVLGVICSTSSGGIVRKQPRNADHAGQGYSAVDT